MVPVLTTTDFGHLVGAVVGGDHVVSPLTTKATSTMKAPRLGVDMCVTQP